MVCLATGIGEERDANGQRASIWTWKRDSRAKILDNAQSVGRGHKCRYGGGREYLLQVNSVECAEGRSGNAEPPERRLQRHEGTLLNRGYGVVSFSSAKPGEEILLLCGQFFVCMNGTGVLFFLENVHPLQTKATRTTRGSSKLKVSVEFSDEFVDYERQTGVDKIVHDFSDDEHDGFITYDVEDLSCQDHLTKSEFEEKRVRLILALGVPVDKVIDSGQQQHVVAAIGALPRWNGTYIACGECELYKSGFHIRLDDSRFAQ